jgi:mono/diheme cytochrome c family protein
MNWKITSLVALIWVTFNVSAADDAQIKRGEYLSTAGDCVACHSVPNGKPFAGGLALPTPIGDIIATNITPSKTAGIGNYSLEQFSDAVRKGIRADGKHLYPAMPYTSYAKVSDEDVKAMYDYFMNAVDPVDAPVKPTVLPFPFNIRASMAVWNLLFLDDKVFVPNATQDVEWNRGAYLVQGLTHCSACHSPRNLMMAEVSSKELAGGDVGPWHAPNITSDLNSGIGGWDNAELVTYLKTGVVQGKAQAAGPMAEAVDHSLQHLNDSDLKAIAVYLKTVPAQRLAADDQPVYTLGRESDELASIRGVALPDDDNQMNGAQLYDAHCSTCHQPQGQGSFEGGLPSLMHNTAVGRSNPNNLVMAILEGVKRGPHGQDIRMQGFANTLSDQQVATLANYVTGHYGNPNIQVSPAQVKELRGGGPHWPLAALAQSAIAVAVIVFILLLLWWVRRRRHP